MVTSGPDTVGTPRADEQATSSASLLDLDRRGALLGAMGEDERFLAFDRLQKTMPDVWSTMRRDVEDESVVVIPSVTLAHVAERTGSIAQAYEERFLFLLLLLR